MSEPRFFRIRNLSTFQHYRNRKPPWIKWHRESLENREFMELPAAVRWLAVAVTLVGTETEKPLPLDPGWWTWKLRDPVTQKDLDSLLSSGFIEIIPADASNMLAQSQSQSQSQRRDREEKNARFHSRAGNRNSDCARCGGTGKIPDRNVTGARNPCPACR